MKVLFIRKKYLIPLLILVAAIIFLIVHTLVVQSFVAQVSGNYREDIPIYSVECEGKKCAITFDCAWGADDIPDILDALDKYRAKATFFVVGLWAEKYPDKVKLINDRGHEVANHGYSHAHMAQLPEAKIEEEIRRCSEVIEKITGAKVSLFRPPYGEYNAATVRVSRRIGHQVVQWDVDSLDWKKEMSAEDIYKRVTQRVQSGSIILFHNDTQYTQEVLPSILENLTNNGYECVTASQLIYKDNYRIRYDGRQIKE